MNMISVSSSAISAIGYDVATKRMKTTFKQGSTYDYCRVPEHIFNGLLSASSKGSYYDVHIKDKFLC